MGVGLCFWPGDKAPPNIRSSTGFFAPINNMAEPNAKDFKIERYVCLSAALLTALAAVLAYKLNFFWFFSERIHVAYLLLPQTWSALNALGNVAGYNFGIICAVHLGLLIGMTGTLREVLARRVGGEVGLKFWLHSAIAPGVNILLEIAGVLPLIIVDSIANPEKFSLLKVLSGLWESFRGLTYISGSMSPFLSGAMLMGENGLYVFGLIQMSLLGLIIGVCMDGCLYVLKKANVASSCGRGAGRGALLPNFLIR